MDEQIPAWAIELIRQVERLNEKIPTHVEWVERNIKDHEVRIRELEQVTPKDLHSQLGQLNQFRWVLMGIAIASGGLGAALTKIMGG